MWNLCLYIVASVPSLKMLRNDGARRNDMNAHDIESKFVMVCRSAMLLSAQKYMTDISEIWRLLNVTQLCHIFYV